MAGTLRNWRSRPGTVLGVALYAAFLVIAPFEHHDLACHLKTPQHCTSCTTSVLGANTATSPNPGATVFHDAGCAVAIQVSAPDLLLSMRGTGRSPPALI